MTDAEAPAKAARGRTAATAAKPRAKDVPDAPAGAKRAPAKGKAAAAAAATTPSAVKATAPETKAPRSTAKATAPGAPKRAPTGTQAAPKAAKPRATKAPDARAKAPRAKAAKAEAAAPKPAARKAAKPEAAGKPASTKQAAAAGPAAAPARARRTKAPPPLLDRMVAAAVASLEDDKAEDIVVLDISTRSSFADRMIVASGLSDRQLQAMARNVEDALAEAGWKRVRIEASPDWVLLDAGDVVIHLFRPATREAYGLERMWGPESPNG